MSDRLSIFRRPLLQDFMAAVAPLGNPVRFALLAGSLSGALLLTACADGDAPMVANNAQNPASSQMTDATNEYLMMVNQLRRTSQCITEVENRLEFAPIRVHTSDRAVQSGEAYTDRNRVASKESALVNRFSSSIQGCRPIFGALIYPHHQEVVQNIDMIWNNQSNLYADLGAGSVSWGQFNQLTKSNSIKLGNLFNALITTDNPSALRTASGEPSGNNAAKTHGLTTKSADSSTGEKNMARHASNRRNNSSSMASALPPPDAGAEGFMLHLASYHQKAMAENGWFELQEKSGALLQNIQPTYSQVQIPGRGTFTRISVGPYSSRQEAAELCSRLKRARMYCHVMAAGSY
ncbi:hypothetical protein CCP2SC5_180002 [Azospirillaceae bacterium]